VNKAADDAAHDPETVAQIAAHGKANLGTAESPLESEAGRRFRASAEHLALERLVAEVDSSLNRDADVHANILVNRGFLMMLAFIEAREAAQIDRPPRPVPKLLANTLNNCLHDMLHTLAVSPLDISYYRAVWNRLCHESGTPGKKISYPGAKVAVDGPF
jgi:hypothetical protein